MLSISNVIFTSEEVIPATLEVICDHFFSGQDNFARGQVHPRGG